jgi:hypothetical protein
MATNDALAAANKLFYTAVRNGRNDTIDTIAAAIWWLVNQQVSAELAGELI